jgi:signal transduction histidine kinase
MDERKKTAEALRESKNRLKTVIENLSEGLVVVDPKSGTLAWNLAALHMHGYHKHGEEPVLLSDVLRVFYLRRLDGTSVPVEQWPVARLLQGEEIRDCEFVVRRAEGRERILSYSGTLVRDRTGQDVIGLLTIRDVTDLKKTQQALVRTEKLASVGRIAATIAHEINNPLAAVTNTLFLAKGIDGMPELARQYLELADAELRRIAHITRQSLGFYRESTSPALTSVATILDSAVDLLQSKIKAKHAVIERHWEDEVQVTAVAGELRQVISNMLLNSLDAIDDTGVIAVRVSTATWGKDGTRHIRITIADNGKGIEAGSRERIFEPFYTTKGSVGTGLGLWVSKQLIDKQGGSIRVRSNTDGSRRGTTFLISLPC